MILRPNVKELEVVNRTGAGADFIPRNEKGVLF